MGALTALEYARRMAGRSNLPLPNSVVSNPDANVVQILGTLNELGEDLQTRRSSWFDGCFWYDNSVPAKTPRCYVEKDTDKSVAPDSVVLAWLSWKWKSKKGLEYAEDFAQYERLVGMFTLKTFPGDVLDATSGPGHAYDVLTPSLNQRPWSLRRW